MTIARLLAVPAALAALAQPAAALSCLAPSVATSFAAANAAEAEYVMAVGRFALLPGEAVPEQPDDPNARQGYSVQTRFQGRTATNAGFTEEVTGDVTVEVGCAGPWCGAVPLGRVLVFLERRGDALVLTEGPCPRFALDATAAREDEAIACATGGCATE